MTDRLDRPLMCQAIPERQGIDLGPFPVDTCEILLVGGQPVDLQFVVRRQFLPTVPARRMSVPRMMTEGSGRIELDVADRAGGISHHSALRWRTRPITRSGTAVTTPVTTMPPMPPPVAAVAPAAAPPVTAAPPVSARTPTQQKLIAPTIARSPQ